MESNMITMLDLGINGRLGNQMFQFAAIRNLALEKGYVLKLPDPKHRNWQGQPSLLRNFRIPDEVWGLNSSSGLKHGYREPDYMKFETLLDLPPGTDISGYFQSTLYFKEHEKQIKFELTPRYNLMLEALDAIDSISDRSKQIVSVHLRRGDNTDGSNPSADLNDMYKDFYPRYLHNALTQFDPQECDFLVFTGGKRGNNEDNSEDIEWCKKFFKASGYNFHFSEGATPIQDFCRIAVCDAHILSHVSSFGWWSAFVGGGTCVAPRHYHPDRPNYTHREGFFPKEWILV